MHEYFELGEAVYRRLAKRADQSGVGALLPSERHMLLAWWPKGEIDNGGFALLYSGEVDIAAVEETFGSIGQPLLAQACAISRDVFDNREPPSTSSERRRVISTLHDLAVGKDPWADANRFVWSVSE